MFGAGGGGGWNGSAATEAFGAPLAAGGMGGNSCNPVAENPAVGGFGGGGGGCTNGEGGGGGGFNGGNAVTNSSGEGGLSFVSPLAVEWLSESERAHHAGPGSADVMPAIAEGCGCELFCVVLDPSLEERQCVCGAPGSDEWVAEDNVTKCGGRWRSFLALSIPVPTRCVLPRGGRGGPRHRRARSDYGH